jgi:pilus assembly protein CpaB
MARIRIFVVLALAVTAGGTFAYGTYQYMQTLASSRPEGVKTRMVVVASTDLDIGAELRAEDMRAIQWPEEAVPEGVFQSPDELVGRGVVQPIAQNEVLLPSKIASKEAGSGLPPIIPDGQRAMSVRVNDVIGVAGYVLPGTRVDVIATVNTTQRPEDVQSKVVLTNVQVLTAGTKIERDENDNKPIAVSVVTLLVDPAQAERLTLASTEGKIQLALRNRVDTTAPATAGVKPSVLMAGGAWASPVRRSPSSSAPKAVASAAPAPRAESAMTVEIIRGDKRARETVSEE